MDFILKDRYHIDDLLKIVSILRSENGCPWDKEQTHESIRKNFIEETYEVIEAIDNSDAVLLREELGDVLLQVALHAQMEEETGTFSFDDVANDICKKLIVRHPHVFGNVQADNTEQVLKNWDEIKKKTKGQNSQTEVLRSVPKMFPALMRSEKVQHKAAKVGFDYPNFQWAFKDLKSELEELEQAISENNVQHQQEELGDVLFSVVNVARFLQVDPELSLSQSCNKFIDRFEQVERLAVQRGINMKESSMEELDQLWKEAKKLERSDA